MQSVHKRLAPLLSLIVLAACSSASESFVPVPSSITDAPATVSTVGGLEPDWYSGYDAGAEEGAAARLANAEMDHEPMNAVPDGSTSQCEAGFLVGYASGYLGAQLPDPGAFASQRELGYMVGWFDGAFDGSLGSPANHVILTGVNADYDAGHIDGYSAGAELGLAAFVSDGYPEGRATMDLTPPVGQVCP